MTTITTHLPHFVVALRGASEPWPTTGKMGAALAKARSDYEAGTVEMAQRREGQTTFQYAIPRKYRATERADYFKPE